MAEEIRKPAPAEYGEGAYIVVNPETKTETIKHAAAGVPEAPAAGPGLWKKFLNKIKSLNAFLFIVLIGAGAFFTTHARVQNGVFVFHYEHPMGEIEQMIFCKTMTTFFDDFEGC